MRPLLLAHRGARKHAPENTLAAFRLAMHHGCDGFELDIRRTADARCILCHDKKFARREVEKSSFDELMQAYLRRVPGCCEDERPPVIERVLESFPNAFVDLEIKVSGVEENVLAAVRAHPPAGGYVVSSFLPEVILKYRDLDPSAPLGLIAQTSRRLAKWSELPIQAVFVYRTLIGEELIQEIHSARNQVFAWTVNSRREMLRFAEWGVDGIISDDTELLVETLGAPRYISD